MVHEVSSLEVGEGSSQGRAYNIRQEEEAVGIEVHKDKYRGAPREDTMLKQTYVLASVFSDDTEIYPVKLLVKEFNDGKKNKLHLAIVVNKKKMLFPYGPCIKTMSKFRTLHLL